MSRKHRILVIDDEEAVRHTICENLEYSGYEVIQATDGQHGLTMIDAQNPPDIIITDIIMPRKEGLEMIVEVKKLHPGIKLIAISGGGRTRTMDFLEIAKKLGADAILPKPVDLEELELVLKNLTS